MFNTKDNTKDKIKLKTFLKMLNVHLDRTSMTSVHYVGGCVKTTTNRHATQTCVKK